MNAIRKLVGLVAVLSLAFAMPAIAGPQKTYTMKADASGASYTPDGNGLQVLNVPAPITITIKNESPPSTANSNISSFRFTVTGMVIVSVDNTACASQGGTCSLDTSTNTVSVTNISSPIQGQETFSVPVTVNSCGDGKWSAQVWTGSQLNGNTFTLAKTALASDRETDLPCGDASCGYTFTVPNSLAVSGTPTYISGIRGDFNKDGSTCSTVTYTATNTIPTNKTLHFAWDSTQSTATFRYTVTFTNPGAPQLAWFTDSNGPVFIDAQACLVTQFANNLPAPYGTLAQDVNATKTKIQVNVTTAPTISVPFPIVIDSERMTVTAIGNNWTVLRGQGGTNASSHTAGAPVMSTPRPILTGPFTTAQTSAGYHIGDQAHGCIAAPTDTNAWATSTTFDIIDIDDIWTFGR